MAKTYGLPKDKAERLIRFKQGNDEFLDAAFVRLWFVEFELFEHCARKLLPAEKLAEIDAAVGKLDDALRKRAEDEIRKEIGAFSRDKPHFAGLRPLMSELFKGGSVRNLDEAYWRALATTEM